MLYTVRVEDPLHCKVSSSSLVVLQVNWNQKVPFTSLWANTAMISIQKDAYNSLLHFAEVLSAAPRAFDPLWWNHFKLQYESVPSLLGGLFVLLSYTVYQPLLISRWFITLWLDCAASQQSVSWVCCFVLRICLHKDLPRYLLLHSYWLQYQAAK